MLVLKYLRINARRWESVLVMRVRASFSRDLVIAGHVGRTDVEGCDHADAETPFRRQDEIGAPRPIRTAPPWRPMAPMTFIRCLMY